MIRTAALLALLASPALAADDTPNGQLVEGYLSCFMGHGDPAMVDPALKLAEWTSEPAEDGLTMARPASGDATFVLIADDASFCHVESLVTGTTDAVAVLAGALQGADTSLPEAGTDADGCTTYDLGNGTMATLMSGGNDPTCTSDSTSGVRFTFQ
jgi:hypothetical protein